MPMTRIRGRDRRGEVLASAARGTIAAMAMTGMRAVTTGLGLVARPPPERIAEHGVPRLVEQVPAERRDDVVELAHWGYGAAAGAAFGALPAAVRRHVWAGPAYGVAIWLFFEVALAPVLLGAEHTRARRLSERLAVAADHVLYGLVVAGRPRRL